MMSSIETVESSSDARVTTKLSSDINYHLARYGRRLQQELGGVPDRLIESVKAINRLKEDYTEELGRVPTLSELAVYLNEHNETLRYKKEYTVDILMQLFHRSHMVSLCTDDGDDENDAPSTFVEEALISDELDPETAYIQARNEKRKKDLLYKKLREVLSSVENEVLHLRFGLQADDEAPMSYRAIGLTLNKSFSAVRKIEQRALAKLRQEPELLALYLAGM